MTLKFIVREVLLIMAIGVFLNATKSPDGPGTCGYSSEASAAPPRAEVKKKRIVVFGTHPEDPVFGCGGLIARLTKSGHEVIIAAASSSRGNRKLGNEPEPEVRRREARAAYEVLGATPHFFDFDHKTFFADEASVDLVEAWFKQTKPDIVVTHWPLDSQSNRHVAGSLVWQCYIRDKKWSLYFFEGLTDYQTVAFTPEIFVDITDFRDLKREACFQMESQKPDVIWLDQEDVHRRRGVECGVRYAEAYVLAEPGLATLPLPCLTKKRAGRD